MVEKGVSGAIFHAVYRYTNTNCKFMKDFMIFHKTFLDTNKLYGSGMRNTLPVNGFEWDKVSRFTGDFIKNYNRNNDIGYFLDADLEYSELLELSYKDFHFLHQKMKRMTNKIMSYILKI